MEELYSYDNYRGYDIFVQDNALDGFVATIEQRRDEIHYLSN